MCGVRKRTVTYDERTEYVRYRATPIPSHTHACEPALILARSRSKSRSKEPRFEKKCIIRKRRAYFPGNSLNSSQNIRDESIIHGTSETLSTFPEIFYLMF